jgi:3'-5' exonuclease
MAKLVFDIETTGLPLETFDDVQQEYLFREAEKLENEEERKTKRAEIQRFFSLWPLTARVVCIAMVNADTLKGQVLYLNPESKEGDPLQLDNGDKGVDFVACKEETALLRGFWEVAKKYDQIVTFNGRGFDVPFVYLRSAVNNVPISRKDWLGYRFATEPHCDLAEQLTFYGVSGRDGAARRFNLDFYCKSFGIESPKAQGITGMDVGHLMEKGCYRDIAEYCLRDVKATVQLYHIWRERLAGIK